MEEENASVLSSHMGGGPHGLGDPNDRTLRVVEKDIVIPKRMKEIAHKEKCPEVVKDFTDCSKATGLLMPFKCRKECQIMTECLNTWYTNKEFQDEVTELYLKDRAEYRRTGISKAQKRKDSSTF